MNPYTYLHPAHHLYAAYLCAAKYYPDLVTFADFERQQPNCGANGFILRRRQARRYLQQLKYEIRKVDPDAAFSI